MHLSGHHVFRWLWCCCIASLRGAASLLAGCLQYVAATPYYAPEAAHISPLALILSTLSVLHAGTLTLVRASLCMLAVPIILNTDVKTADGQR